jgi:hypothetical protein
MLACFGPTEAGLFFARLNFSPSSGVLQISMTKKTGNPKKL